jgi:hypothetical protein
MGIRYHILVVNEKNYTLIKNWPHHQSVSHIYKKLTEINEMTNSA